MEDYLLEQQSVLEQNSKDYILVNREYVGRHGTISYYKGKSSFFDKVTLFFQKVLFYKIW